MNDHPEIAPVHAGARARQGADLSRCRWFSIPAVRRLGVTAVLAVVVGSSTLSDVRAETPDDIGAPQLSPVGTFGGIDYVQYLGVFEGETSTGGFRVPYQI